MLIFLSQHILFMGYLHNLAIAAFVGIFILCIFALAPPLFWWHTLFEYEFLGLPLVDYFIAGFALLLIYLFLRPHFQGGE